MPAVLTREEVVAALDAVTDWPLPIQTWTVEIGPDSEGRVAIWLFGILPDDSFGDADQRYRIRRSARAAVESHVGDDQPIYIRFRTESEV